MLSKLAVGLIVMGPVALVLGGCAPMTPQAVTEIQEYRDGLERIKARRFDSAFVRPGIEFSAYTGLLVEEPELAFRTPDRSKLQFALTRDQKTQFRNLLTKKFQMELAKSTRLSLVENAGPNVLTLKIRVQDILATVPPSSRGGVGLTGFALEAIGEATIVLELRDSQSEETLAHATDRRSLEGAAIIQGGEALTRWSEVEELAEQWASKARKGLDTLLEKQ